MKVSELAKRTEVPAKTIRYYEEIGLIPPAKRSENGYRIYNGQDEERLVFIRRCRELQIPIEQIKQLVEIQEDKSASCQNVDRIIETQLGKVRRAKAELACLEQALNSLAKSCQNQKVSECEILHRLNA